jgi:hypothetical protein
MLSSTWRERKLGHKMRTWTRAQRIAMVMSGTSWRSCDGHVRERREERKERSNAVAIEAVAAERASNSETQEVVYDLRAGLSTSIYRVGKKVRSSPSALV